MKLRTLALLLTFLLSGCASPTPASPTDAPTAAPTPTQSPGPTPTAESTPSQPPITGGWQVINEFPPAGAKVAAITTFANGFVAVGTAGEPDYCDGSSLVEGRIWTAAEGTAWSAADVDLTGLEPRHVVVAVGVIYVFLCTSEQDFVARSADGVEWRVDQISDADWYASGYAAAGDTLLASTDGYDEGQFVGSVWSSSDGVNWAPLPGSPETASGFGLSGLAASGDFVVAYSADARPMFVSTDGGTTWHQADHTPLYNADVFAVAMSGGHFAAVGEACCAAPREYVGFGLWSDDALHWQESQPFGTREIPEGIVALPGGFVTIGRQSWLSSDGGSWVIGPEIPGYEADQGYPPAIGAASSEVAVITNGGTAWIAGLADLEPGLYSDTARVAELPSVGSRYPYTAYTHCGWPPLHFDLRAWAPDPPINAHNPPPGLKQNDHGTLTYVSEDELRYDSERGRVIKLVPSDEPTPIGGCA